MAISRTTRRGGLYGALLVTGLIAAAPVGAQPADTIAISTQPLFVKKDAYYAAGFHHSHPGNRIDDVLLSGSISRGANGGMALRMSILPGAMALSRR